MVWHLDTRILRMLVAVVEAPTAVLAADRLNISASALSHQMKKAEADLRVALFDRRGHRIRLTSAGDQLYDCAVRILAELDAAEERLERTRRGNTAAVRVSGGAYPVQKLLIPRLATADIGQIDFRSRTKAYPLSVALLGGEIDLAIVGARVTQRGLAAVPLFEDALVAVLPSDHPFAEGSCLGMLPFNDETYISYSRIVEDGLEDELLFRPTRAAPSRFVQAESTEAILDLVEAGLGFSILSQWSIPEQRPGLRTIPLVDGGARIVWTLAHRQSERNANVLAMRGRIVAAFEGSTSLCE